MELLRDCISALNIDNVDDTTRKKPSLAVQKSVDETVLGHLDSTIGRKFWERMGVSKTFPKLFVIQLTRSTPPQVTVQPT